MAAINFSNVVTLYNSKQIYICIIEVVEAFIIAVVEMCKSGR